MPGLLAASTSKRPDRKQAFAKKGVAIIVWCVIKYSRVVTTYIQVSACQDANVRLVSPIQEPQKRTHFLNPRDFDQKDSWQNENYDRLACKYSVHHNLDCEWYRKQAAFKSDIYTEITSRISQAYSATQYIFISSALFFIMFCVRT